MHDDDSGPPWRREYQLIDTSEKVVRTRGGFITGVLYGIRYRQTLW